MERSERIGLTVSAAGHGAAIVLALVGGIFNRSNLDVNVAMTEVSVISSDEFAALQARAPTAPTESPEAPSLPDAAPAAADAPEPVEEAGPALTVPGAEDTPEPDAAPDVSELAPVSPEVSPTDPTIDTPPVEVPSETVLETVAPSPRPTDAPRVAPEPSDAPEPDAAPADETIAETAPEPSEEALPETPVEEQAPEEATTQTPVENDVAEVTESSAPLTSARPKARPEKPAPAPEPVLTEAETEAETEQASAAPDASPEPALDEALAEALAGEASEEPQSGTGIAANGSPLTSGEIDAMRVAVKRCWVVDNGAPSASVTVIVGFDMSQDGKVVDGSVQLVDASGGDEIATRAAFEAARRAVLQCQREGYPLPPEKYESWRRVEIVFDPSAMRLR